MGFGLVRIVVFRLLVGWVIWFVLWLMVVWCMWVLVWMIMVVWLLFSIMWIFWLFMCIIVSCLWRWVILCIRVMWLLRWVILIICVLCCCLRCDVMVSWWIWCCICFCCKGEVGLFCWNVMVVVVMLGFVYVNFVIVWGWWVFFGDVWWMLLWVGCWCEWLCVVDVWLCCFELLFLIE